MGFDVQWMAALAAALAATGVIAGLLAGLLGVGGGIVIVPVLFHLFIQFGISADVRMHLAVGTSLATIIPTSLVSARAHLRRGAVDFLLLRSWGAAILIGVLLGAAIGGVVKGWALTAVFAVVALAVAAHMALRPEGTRLRDSLPGPPARDLIGGTIGLVSTMMGIGGGTLSVPILSACGYPIRRAVGTASAIGLIIAVPGAIGFALSGIDVPGRPQLSLGYVNLLGFALIAPLTIVTAPWGARIAHAIPPTRLRQAFAFFLFLTSLRMIYGLVE